MKRYVCRCLVVLTLGIGVNLPAGAALGAADRSAEIKQFSEMFQSPNAFKRIDALKLVYDSGVTDKSVFDRINQQLLADYNAEPSNKLRVDEVSWMCKALATSGLADYSDTLTIVSEKAPSEKVRNYARESLGLVGLYAERNAITVKETEETRGLTPEVAGLVNLLRADRWTLKKEAARKITQSNHRDTKLYEVVQEELLAGLQQNSIEPEHVDAMAWLCKALAASGETRYSETLAKVVAAAIDRKLKKYAQESLDILR